MVYHMLTTVDNPYSPFTQFDEWYEWDTRKGHHSLSLLGRIVKSSDDLSHAQQLQAIEDAIDEIVKYNVSGVHRKVSSPAEVESQQQAS